MNETTLTVYAIPLKDGTPWEPTDAQLAAWQEAFPTVNVREEIYSAAMWAWSNPRKRKTARGIDRFITNWLLRAKTGNENIRRAKQGRANRQSASDRVIDIQQYYDDIVAD